MKKCIIKISFIFSLFLISSGCSTSSPYSQKSIDTRLCNDLSYGNNNMDTGELDTIYNNCMENKIKSRAEKRKHDKNHAIIDSLFNLLIPAEN